MQKKKLLARNKKTGETKDCEVGMTFKIDYVWFNDLTYWHRKDFEWIKTQEKE